MIAGSDVFEDLAGRGLIHLYGCAAWDGRPCDKGCRPNASSDSGDPLLWAPPGLCARHEERVDATSRFRLCGCPLETQDPRSQSGDNPSATVGGRSGEERDGVQGSGEAPAGRSPIDDARVGLRAETPRSSAIDARADRSPAPGLAASRDKPGASVDVNVLRARVYELEEAIGSATRNVCDMALALLPPDAADDRQFVVNVRSRLVRAMASSVWPADPIPRTEEVNEPELVVSTEGEDAIAVLLHGYREKLLRGYPLIGAPRESLPDSLERSSLIARCEKALRGRRAELARTDKAPAPGDEECETCGDRPCEHFRAMVEALVVEQRTSEAQRRAWTREVVRHILADIRDSESLDAATDRITDEIESLRRNDAIPDRRDTVVAAARRLCEKWYGASANEQTRMMCVAIIVADLDLAVRSLGSEPPVRRPDIESGKALLDEPALCAACGEELDRETRAAANNAITPPRGVVGGPVQENRQVTCTHLHQRCESWEACARRLAKEGGKRSEEFLAYARELTRLHVALQTVRRDVDATLKATPMSVVLVPEEYMTDAREDEATKGDRQR